MAESPSQSGSDRQRGTLNSPGAIALLFVVLSSLYVLSLGPVVWLYDQKYLPEPLKDWIKVVYMPLALLIRHKVEPFDRILTWYVELFR